MTRIELYNETLEKWKGSFATVLLWRVKQWKGKSKSLQSKIQEDDC